MLLFSLLPWLSYLLSPSQCVCLGSECKMGGCCLWYLKTGWRNISVCSLKYIYMYMYIQIHTHTHFCAIVWDVHSEFCLKFSFTEACSEGKCGLQISGVTEGFSDIIKIRGFLKAFQTKILVCSLSWTLSRVSISTLASLTEMFPRKITDIKTLSCLGAHYPRELWAMDSSVSYFLALMTRKEVSNTSLVLFKVIL